MSFVLPLSDWQPLLMLNDFHKKTQIKVNFKMISRIKNIMVFLRVWPLLDHKPNWNTFQDWNTSFKLQRKCLPEIQIPHVWFGYGQYEGKYRKNLNFPFKNIMLLRLYVDAENKFAYLFNSFSLIQLQVTLKNQNQEVFSISGDRGNQWIAVERNIRLIAGERVSTDIVW